MRAQADPRAAIHHRASMPGLVDQNQQSQVALASITPGTDPDEARAILTTKLR